MPTANIRPWRDMLDHHAIRVATRYPVLTGRRYDPWWDKNTCEYCGRVEQTVKAPLQVVLCREHWERTHDKHRIQAEGRVKPITNFFGWQRCAVCGRSEPVMYEVEFRELCHYCLWYTFGGQRRGLRVEGVRVL